MNVTAIARDWRTKVLAAMVAVATVFGMVMYIGNGSAEASPNREHLRPGCDFTDYNYWVQKCWVYSAEMDKDIPVEIVPSIHGNNKSLTLLDGLRMPLDGSDWTGLGDAPQVFEDANINLVMPGGAPASFYTDWESESASAQQPEGFNYKYETFVAHELPQYLSDHFGIDYGGNSIAGLSMGASAAFTFANNYPEKWGQVLSFSGYLNPSSPAMSAAIPAAMLDAGGYSATDMWGVPGTGRWVENDPFMNIATTAANGTDVYITSGSGLPSNLTDPIILQDPVGQATGATLEALSMASTQQYEVAARAAGVNVTTSYSFDGIHAWGTWNRNLWESKDHVLNFLGGW